MPLNIGAHAAADDDVFANAPPVIDITDNETNMQGSPPPRASNVECTHARSLASPAATKQVANPLGYFESSLDYPPVQANTQATMAIADADGTYTLPTGYFGLGLGGPTTPI
jgi:hypothetical protein